MQTPQPISKASQIDLKINVIRTQIWALEMGHDFLSRDDKEQIKAWQDQIAKLNKKKEKVGA